MHLIKALIPIFALSGSIAAQHAEEEGLTRRQELTAAREELLVARDNYLAVRDNYLAVRDRKKAAGKSAPKTGGGFTLPVRPKVQADVGRCLQAPSGKVMCMVGMIPCKVCEIPPEYINGPCTCPLNYPKRI